VVFLLVYVALEWAAEVYYLWHWIQHNDDPVIPSIADVFWLSSYLFLISGCWVVAAGYKGLRLQAKDAFLHGAWIAAAGAILIWLGREVIASNKPPVEAVVMGLYPFFDAIAISLVLVIRSRHRCETTRVFWFVLLIACLSMLAGDVMWLLSRSGAGSADALVKVGDAFYILAYLLDVVTLWAGLRLERVRASDVRSAETAARLKRALSAGGINSLASLPVIAVIVSVAEKGLGMGVSGLNLSPPVLLVLSGGLAFALKAGFRRWEKRLETGSMYREAFRQRLQHGYDLNPEETAFLDRLRATLRLSSEGARAIEAAVLHEKEEELRARLEAVQRDALERRSAQEWESRKTAWLGSIRDLSRQLDSELASTVPNPQ
jgi:hypothetical protein